MSAKCVNDLYLHVNTGRYLCTRMCPVQYIADSRGGGGGGGGGTSNILCMTGN